MRVFGCRASLEASVTAHELNLSLRVFALLTVLEEFEPIHPTSAVQAMAELEANAPTAAEDAPDAISAAGFLAPGDLAAAKAQVISKSGKRGWVDWRKSDWDRWGRAPRATQPLEVSEGRAFVLSKVPLKERYNVAYGGEGRIHTPHMLIERVQEKKRRLSCVIDATLRRAGDFHDVGDWDDWDVERVSLRKDARPCARFRDPVPLNKDLDAAVLACGKAWNHPSVVAFISVDGCNTAGCCAIATLVDLCGVEPRAAWDGVRAGRAIFSEGHVALLNARYPGNDFEADAAPDWYGGPVEGDEEDDPEVDDEPAPAPKKRERADAGASDAPAAEKPRNKRPKLRKAAAAAAPPPNDLRHGELRTLDVHATAPDGTRSKIGGLATTFEMCPPALEVRPDAYDKDLPKIAQYASFGCTVAGDTAGLAGLLKYLRDRKKAAVLCRGPPRVYLPPQEIGAGGELELRFLE